jgi:ABC-type multidrug transport system ATPase subunit
LKLTTAPASPPEDTSGAARPAVELHDLSFSYGERRALDGLTLSIPAGSIFGLLGPNGAGKSTTLAMLIGRRVPASGSMTILGEKPSDKLRRRLAMVFQEPSLDPVMTVRETMWLQGRMFGLARAEITSRSALLLERVGLADRAGSATATLSGGMKRRLELARALLTDPELILLDEPTLALDPDSRLALWQHLLEANAAGRTLLLATNDVYEAERYCQRVAMIAEGRVVAEGTPAELKRGLRHDAVRVEWKTEPAPEDLAEIERWPGVGGVRPIGRVTHVTVDEASPFLARLFQECGDRVHGVQVEESTLEDAYFQTVGRGIAAGGASAEAE